MRHYHLIFVLYTHRNLSLVGSEQICDSLVREDIMTPLSAMIRDCLAKLDQIRTKKTEAAEKSIEGASAIGEGGGEGGGKGASSAKAIYRQRLKADIEEEQWSGALEQGLHLLWNVR